MIAARLLGVGACTLALAVPAHAQQPTIDASAIAMRAQPLPVVDDYGQVISEDLIHVTMRDRTGRSLAFTVVGALVGVIVFAARTSPSHDCTIYDPCTPQEEYYRDKGPLVGLFVGALVGAAIPNGSVDREGAVKLLRARRRAARSGGTP